MIIKYDIAIIGSGLTGTTASMAFAKAGYSIALIDPKSFKEFIDNTYDTRTTALSKKAKDFFVRIGIWKSLEPYTCKIKNILVNDGKLGENIYFKKEKANYSNNALGFMIKNTLLFKTIINHIKKFNNITKYNTKIIKFERNNEEVLIKLANKKSIKCYLIIGADGKNSSIRKMAGIPITKKDYRQKAFIFDVKHEKKHNYLATENFLEQGPLASLPIIHNKSLLYSSIVWSCNYPFYYKVMQFNKIDLENTLNFYLSNSYGKSKVISEVKSWDLSLIKANKFYDHRLILLGDSAHSIHPLAGQGFNLTLKGIESLYNLAQVYKTRKINIGSFESLSIYNKSQYIDALSIILATDKLNYLFSNSNIFLKAIRKVGLRAFNKSEVIKNIFKNYASDGKLSMK